VSNRGSLTDRQRQAAAAFIATHLDRRISVATLAGVAQLSPFHFARAFKRSFGLSPHRYHMAQRIERAKLLLKDPALSIAAVGRAVGFGRGSGFSATFRRLADVTPSEFRHRLHRRSPAWPLSAAAGELRRAHRRDSR
jgi:AraC family transcriptional regulator